MMWRKVEVWLLFNLPDGSVEFYSVLSGDIKQVCFELAKKYDILSIREFYFPNCPIPVAPVNGLFTTWHGVSVVMLVNTDYAANRIKVNGIAVQYEFFRQTKSGNAERC